MSMTKSVTRGANLLDRRFGRKWAQKISVPKLDLQSSTSCILGQLYGDEASWDEDGYMIGLRELGLDDKESTEYGFMGPENRYATLTKTWIREIGKRLGRAFR